LSYCVVRRIWGSLSKLNCQHRICNSLLKLSCFQHSLQNCVVCSEFGIRCRSWIVCSEFVIRCWNWFFYSELTFTVELCVLQRIYNSLPKLSFVCNKLTFAAKLCVVHQIWDSLPKLYCLQWICNWLQILSCLKRINISCRIKCFAANLGFAAEVVLFVAKL